MAGGSPAPTDRTDTVAHINAEYDSDEDGVIERARDADTLGGKLESELNVADASTVGGKTATQLSSDLPYGDGSDGTITRSANLNENGVIYATDYTLESGVTGTVTNGVLVIHATNSIQIDGTLDVSGQGITGTAGGNGWGGDGSGFSAPYPWGNIGQGGNGGNTDSGSGAGVGGNINYAHSASYYSALRTFGTGPLYDQLHNLAFKVAGGTGGGGGGGDGGGDGGAGGDGAGAIMLVAPQITVTGTIRADGTNGSRGADSTDYYHGGGGGGGGGSGGFIILAGRTLDTSNATLSASRGSGGNGGDGYNWGDDGRNGKSGYILKFTQ